MITLLILAALVIVPASLVGQAITYAAEGK